MKLLLDTDIGSDIDDAICLAYLLAQPSCELLGITTVSGQSKHRAMIASALCCVVGKSHIPIYPGAESPLIIEQRQPEAPQANKLLNWPHKTDYPVGEAIAFMRKTIRDNPHEITLLTIGPLTNIALLFASDPEIPSLLKGLIMMAGAYTTFESMEWNVILDPHAAAIVYRHAVHNHRSIGLDVTIQVIMSKNDVKAQFNTPLLEVVYDFAKVWFEKTDYIVFHDPLAATTIFDDHICKFDYGTITIDLPIGKMHWNPEKFGQHEMATTVNPEHFFQHFFTVIKNSR